MLRKRLFVNSISAILVTVILGCLILITAIPAYAKSYIKNPDKAIGSDYTGSSSLASALESVFAGDIDVYSNSACTKEVSMPIGINMSNSTQYYAKNKTTKTNVSGWQCYIYANAVYNKLFNETVGHATSLSHSKVVISGGSNKVTYQMFSNAGVKCGAYIRTTGESSGAYNGNSGHSLIVLSYNSSTITYLEGNGDGNGAIRIAIATWSEFNSGLLSGAGKYISHVVQPTDAYYDSLYSNVTKDYIATDFNPTIKDGIYTLKIAHTSATMLNVYNGTNDWANNPALTTWEKDGTAEQKFYFKHESKGKYRIYAVCSGANGSVYNKVVDVNIGPSTSDVLNIGDSFDIWNKDSSFDYCQLFYIVHVGEGKYVIELASTPNAVLAAKNAENAATNGGAITLRNYEGYTTQQWYFYNENGTAPVDPSIDNSLTYTVNYNTNGGSNPPSAQSKLYGTTLTLSTTVPTKSGYSFVGWSTSNDTTVEYQAGATYTANADVTLYAVWKADQYTVSYNANGGTNPPASQKKVHDTALTLSTTVPTKSGYSFVGWSTSNDTTVEYQAGATYTANADVTLYAVWKADEYTISYNANGGTNPPASQKKVHGTALTLSTTVPTKSGYSFVGWSTSNDTTVEYQAGATYTANADVTLYAVWKADEYTVSYNANGGTNLPESQKKVHDTALTLSTTVPTKLGYSFVGWSTSNDTSVEYNAGSTYSVNTSVTLYAVWKANEYTVTYNANGGSNAPSAQTKVYEETLILSNTIPTKTGYTFTGWSTSSDATNVIYQAGGIYTNNDDAILYAVWKQDIIEDNLDNDFEKETTADKETTVDKETTADKETAVDKETTADKEITVDKETVADKPNNDKNDKENDKEITNDSEESGCNSSVALSAFLTVGAIGIAFSCKKRKDD